MTNVYDKEYERTLKRSIKRKYAVMGYQFNGLICHGLMLE